MHNSVHRAEMPVASKELTHCFDNCNTGKNRQNISLESVPPVLKAILHCWNKVELAHKIIRHYC